MLRTCVKCGGKRDRPGQRYCGACHAAYMREWRKTHPLEGEALRRANARCYANACLRRGKLQREPCEECGEPGQEMHHDDYGKPLEVRWFCRRHHYAKHGRRVLAEVLSAERIDSPA